MRKLLALMVMFCGAGSALAFPNTANYCSDGFDKPARLSIRGQSLELTVGDEISRYTVRRYTSTKDGVLVTGDADGLELYSFEVRIGDDVVIVFRDHVFWPCAQ
jgi:hypothetical protein